MGNHYTMFIPDDKVYRIVHIMQNKDSGLVMKFNLAAMEFRENVSTGCPAYTASQMKLFPDQACFNAASKSSMGSGLPYK
jgi:hypothetical protein